MSLLRCIVCGEPKKKWHLACPECWAKVPPSDQAEVYELYRKGRGSDEHREKCFAVLRALRIQRHADLTAKVEREKEAQSR